MFIFFNVNFFIKKLDIIFYTMYNYYIINIRDPGTFRIKLKEKTDKLLSLNTIEIDQSFEQVDDKSKFIIISALEKLSEIPLVKNALKHNGQICKLMG